jgi:hypothetical protein
VRKRIKHRQKGKAEKSQTPAGIFFIGLKLGGASLETRNNFPWVSEIFPSCPLTGVRSFISLFYKDRGPTKPKTIKLVFVASP